MSGLMDCFIEEARAVPVGEAASRLGLDGLRRTTHESVGACPACGSSGKSKRPDGFSIAPGKNAWNCRQGSIGGRDGIGLAAHVLGYDVRRKEDFVLACAAVLGRPAPDGAEESAADRAAREERLADQRRANEAAASQAAKGQAEYREKERRKARGKWQSASGSGLALDYLAGRLGVVPRDLPPLPFLRSIAAEPYWHGTDEGDRPLAVHEGPAMVAPFVDPSGLVVGCHLTWIDMGAGRNLRPRLLGADGDVLETKKMRGTKKGGLIPLVGFVTVDGAILPDPSRPRFVIGEGIENVVAVAVAERWRMDTIYAAAGDLGNLAGPAEPSSGFAHPTLRKVDSLGRERAVRVAGPVPKAGQSEDEAVQAPEHATSILLVADGDSERWATASKMARAETRLAPGRGGSVRFVSIAWPPIGLDFAEILAGAPEREVA